MTGDTLHDVAFREAIADDLEAIVSMLSDDVLGAERERFEIPLPDAYSEAFAAIESDPNNELIVACRDDEVIGVLQVTFIPYLTYQGGWRAQVEGVRVHANHRSGGLGRLLLEHAIGKARERGCHLVQLTTDKARDDALRFYESLGFRASHEGIEVAFGPDRRRR